MSAGIHKLDFSTSDDVRTPEKTRVETLTIGNAKVARLTAQVGCRKMYVLIKEFHLFS